MLSAFNLMMTVPGSPSDVASVETIYQSSKVFGGNPRTDEDRYLLSPRDARQRAQQLGGNVPFTGWSLDGNDVHLETRTCFYDWLYLRALGEILHLQ